MSYTFAHLNCRSLVPSLADVRVILNQRDLDILALTETWLSDVVCDDVVRIAGYRFVRRDRGGRGGGVGMYVRDSLECKIVYLDDTIESLWVSLQLKGLTYYIGVVYNPNVRTANVFLDSLETQFSELLPACDELFCLGDFNIDVLRVDDVHCIRLLDMLETFHLRQLVDFPTRVTPTSSTAIDLIVTGSDCTVGSVEVVGADNISDHDLILCRLSLTAPVRTERRLLLRNFRALERDAFLEDLYSLPLYHIFDIMDIDQKVAFLTDSLLHLFDAHAPLRYITVKKSGAPWLSQNTRLLMSLRDEAKAKWKRSKLVVDFEEYKARRNFTAKVVRSEKRAYLGYSFKEGISPAVAWRRLRAIGVVKADAGLSETISDADAINRHFVSAVPASSICNTVIGFYSGTSRAGVDRSFDFRLVTEGDVGLVLGGLRSESMGCDGIGLRMLQYCHPYLIPYITHLVNSCIETSTFPSCWKEAKVVPIPKSGLARDFKDLRPISILPTLSKVLERVLEQQLRSFFAECGVVPDVQSGFKSGHSCETALLHITDDIVRGLDEGRATVLVLLDFSKAFDSLNHALLLSILSYNHLSQSAVDLLSSYLQDRAQRVAVGGDLSDLLPLTSGVPQGSILSPLLFAVYTSGLPAWVNHSVVHMYADDTQMYLSFRPCDVDLAMDLLNADLESISRASRNHGLHLNASKTKAILFDRPSMNINHDEIVLRMNGERVEVVDKARNLGVVMDSGLNFSSHISTTLQKSYGSLKLIYGNRSVLNRDSKRTLCDSLVLSRFNFCNVLYGPFLSFVDRQRIQKLQNSCLRLIYGIRRRNAISYKLIECKWLNMERRRTLHSLCLYHKIIRYKCPPYLYNKISYRTDIHNLNLRHRGLLSIPIHRTEFFKRSYSYQVVNAYNRVPSELRCLSPLSFRRICRARFLANDTS